VIGGDISEGVVGFRNASLARYGGEFEPVGGDEGGEEFGCRKGEELNIVEEDDDEDGVNIPDELKAGDEGVARLNR
jgi:hypothetical protein